MCQDLVLGSREYGVECFLTLSQFLNCNKITKFIWSVTLAAELSIDVYDGFEVIGHSGGTATGRDLFETGLKFCCALKPRVG